MGGRGKYGGDSMAPLETRMADEREAYLRADGPVSLITVPPTPETATRWHSPLRPFVKVNCQYILVKKKKKKTELFIYNNANFRCRFRKFPVHAILQKTSNFVPKTEEIKFFLAHISTGS